MKNIRYGSWIIILLLLIYILFFGESSNCKHKKIIMPAKVGAMPIVVKPVQVPALHKEFAYSKDNTEKDTVRVTNPINPDLWNTYLAYYNKDSLYADAIGEREYHIEQEDSVLFTRSRITTRGELLNYHLEHYTIKSSSASVRSQKNKYRILAGIEVGCHTEIPDISIKTNVMLQTKNGDIISFGYDTEQRMYAGYTFSIFTAN